MTKKIETIQELEELWIRLEQEIFDWIDQVIDKAGIDKEKQSEEIHQVKLRIEEITNQQLDML